MFDNVWNLNLSILSIVWWYEIWKSLYYCLQVTLWKCQYCLMSEKVRSIAWEQLPEVLETFDMNSENVFTIVYSNYLKV